MKYKVICKDWDENFDDENCFEVNTFWPNPDDAVEHYCHELGSQSNFTDGYLDNMEFWTQDEEGNVMKFKVGTDFEPTYYTREIK